MENLITRLRHMGVLLVFGFILIIYIALGFVYLQQGGQQTDLTEQINQLSLVVAKQLPPIDELREEYDKVNIYLAPMTDIVAINKLKDIASESGIDISDKLIIPPASFRDEKRSADNYRVLSFTKIIVTGDYDSVMAFISDLDSGNTLKTMVLKGVAISQTGNVTAATMNVDIYTKPGR